MSADTADDTHLRALLTLVDRCARAYCGPAHGTSWPVDLAAPLPRTVDLGVGDARTSYRLVQDPRTRRPARDQLGNYLYMPVRYTVEVEVADDATHPVGATSHSAMVSGLRSARA